MFWVFGAGLIAISAATVLWGLTRRPGGLEEQISRDDTVKALYRDRLDELQREMENGQLSAEQRQSVEQELGADLLVDFQADQNTTAISISTITPTLAIAAAVAVVAGSLMVYWVIGDPGAQQIKGAEIVLRLDPESAQSELLAWRVRLQNRVGRSPEDAQSWYLLGHVGLKLAEYQHAAEAFATASATSGGDSGVDAYWLQARYLAAEGRLDGTSRVIAERILQGNPSHPLVLEMYAISAYRSGEYRESVSYLNRALADAINPSQRAALLAGMQQARNRLGDMAPSLDIAITVAAPAPAGATLFVIARPVGGGMPLAVVRRPAIDFPLSIRLDDAVSMNPAQPLSSAQRIEVAVRISLSGTPMAQPGDWEWASEPLELAGLEQPMQLNAPLLPPGVSPGAPPG